MRRPIFIYDLIKEYKILLISHQRVEGKRGDHDKEAFVDSENSVRECGEHTGYGYYGGIMGYHKGCEGGYKGIKRGVRKNMRELKNNVRVNSPQ